MFQLKISAEGHYWHCQITVSRDYTLVQAQPNLINNRGYAGSGLNPKKRNSKLSLINCHLTVIKLQDLISVKDNQVANFHSSVKTSVETAVVKSFSEAVQAVQPPCGSPVVRSPPVINKTL